MEDIEKIKEIKEKFEKGEITQEEMDEDTQWAVADLYKAEIESIRENISNIREDREVFNVLLKDLNKVEDLIDNYEE